MRHSEGLCRICEKNEAYYKIAEEETNQNVKEIYEMRHPYTTYICEQCFGKLFFQVNEQENK